MTTALTSQLFIDGGDPAETLAANELLKTKKPEWQRGIEGQTTNPTLVSKNPDVQKYLAQGKKLTQAEARQEYKKIIQAVAKVTQGPVSIQVIADASASARDMLAQARVYKDWIPNGVVKFPCTLTGLAAAEIFCQEFPVNITLNFSQQQAAAVYGATKNAKHRVFISPFVGRLDDRGENGMQVVENELRMYQRGAGPVAHVSPDSLQTEGPLARTTRNNHVEVLTASLRTIDHLLYAIKLGSSAITIPFKIFKIWADGGFQLPSENYQYDPGPLKSIPYEQLSLDADWHSFNLQHDLTDAGLKKFMEDWQALLA